MVQILEGEPSFLQSLGIGASQALPGAVDKYFTGLAQKRQQQQANEAYKKLTGKDLAGLPPEAQQAVAAQLLKQSGESEGRKQQQEMLSGIFNPQQGKQAYQNQKVGQALAGDQETTADEVGLKSSSPRRFSNEQIARATVENPALGRELRAAEDAAAKEEREIITAKEKKQEVLRAETFPIKKEISDKAQAARDSIRNKQNQMDIIKRGDLDDPSFAAAMESLPFNYGKRFLSPDTVEYKAGLVDEFKDLRQIFQGATRVKEIDILEGKIADIYLTDEQKMAILESRIDAAKVDLIREEAALELEGEGKNYGVLQYRNELEKRAKPKIDALFNRVLDQQKSIIQDAENMKKIPLNYDDAEGRIILEQIMKEAGNDRNKARQIAKKKGYTVGN